MFGEIDFIFLREKAFLRFTGGGRSGFYTFVNIWTSISVIIMTVSLLGAAPVTIANHSFEDGAGLPEVGTWNNNNPEGWVADETGGQIGLQADDPAPVGVDGIAFTFVQGDATSILQDITNGPGSSAVVGDVFKLTVAALNQNASPSFDFDITNFAGESLIGGPITTPVAGDWTDYEVVGTVDTASAEIRLVLNANGPQIRFDNVRLDFETSVEEVLEITEITRVPGENPGMVDVTITWASQPDVTYGIEASDSTLDQFEEIDDVEAIATSTSFTESVPEGTTSRFYRIRKM